MSKSKIKVQAVGQFQLPGQKLYTFNNENMREMMKACMEAARKGATNVAIFHHELNLKYTPARDNSSWIVSYIKNKRLN